MPKTEDMLTEIRDILKRIEEKAGPTDIPKPPKPLVYGTPSSGHSMGTEFELNFVDSTGYSAKYVRLELNKSSTVHFWMSGEKITIPWTIPANEIITLTEFTDKILIETDISANLRLYASFIPPADSGSGTYATYDVPGGIS